MLSRKTFATVILDSVAAEAEGMGPSAGGGDGRERRAKRESPGSDIRSDSQDMFSLSKLEDVRVWNVAESEGIRHWNHGLSGDSEWKEIRVATGSVSVVLTRGCATGIDSEVRSVALRAVTPVTVKPRESDTMRSSR